MNSPPTAAMDAGPSEPARPRLMRSLWLEALRLRRESGARYRGFLVALRPWVLP